MIIPDQLKFLGQTIDESWNLEVPAEQKFKHSGDGSIGVVTNFLLTPLDEVLDGLAKKIFNNIFGGNRSFPTKRPRALVLTADVDHNGALELTFFPFNRIINTQVHKELERMYEVVYKRINNLQTLCQAIDAEKAKGHSIALLVINAHGDPSSIQLSDEHALSINAHLPENSCFQNLSSDVTIVFNSCAAGFGRENNFNLANYIVKHCPKNARIFSAIDNISHFKILNRNPSSPEFGFYRGMDSRNLAYKIDTFNKNKVIEAESKITNIIGFWESDSDIDERSRYEYSVKPSIRDPNQQKTSTGNEKTSSLYTLLKEDLSPNDFYQSFVTDAKVDPLAGLDLLEAPSPLVQIPLKKDIPSESQTYLEQSEPMLNESREMIHASLAHVGQEILNFAGEISGVGPALKELQKVRDILETLVRNPERGSIKVIAELFKQPEVMIRNVLNQPLSILQNGEKFLNNPAANYMGAFAAVGSILTFMSSVTWICDFCRDPKKTAIEVVKMPYTCIEGVVKLGISLIRNPEKATLQLFKSLIKAPEVTVKRFLTAVGLKKKKKRKHREEPARSNPMEEARMAKKYANDLMNLYLLARSKWFIDPYKCIEEYHDDLLNDWNIGIAAPSCVENYFNFPSFLASKLEQNDFDSIKLYSSKAHSSQPIVPLEIVGVFQEELVQLAKVEFASAAIAVAHEVHMTATDKLNAERERLSQNVNQLSSLLGQEGLKRKLLEKINTAKIQNGLMSLNQCLLTHVQYQNFNVIDPTLPWPYNVGVKRWLPTEYPDYLNCFPSYEPSPLDEHRAEPIKVSLDVYRAYVSCYNEYHQIK